MNNITFIVFAYNEEKRLPYVLKNLLKYGRVCVMDGGSTDKTKEIAEQAGAEFFLRPANVKPYVETPENFEQIKSIVKTDWIYWGYTDNFVPKTLLNKLVEVSQQDKIKYVLIPLYTYLWGNTEHYAQKGYAPFFFHKDFVDFSQNHIHGIGRFTGSKDQMLKLPNREEYALKHFSTYNLDKFVRGHLRYAETEAQDKFLSGQKFSVLRLIRAMIGYAWIFTKQNYKNGKLGFLIMLNYVNYRVMAYTRLYELEHGITLEKIEENYSRRKEQLLKDF